MPLVLADPAQLPLPRRLQQMDDARLRAYRDNLAFYQGRQWLGRARPGERRLTFNYAKALVEKVTSYLLNGQAIQVEARDGDTEAGRERARAAERALREIEASNAVAQLDYETELDAAILGDGCYRVTWDTAEGAVRITAPDVQGVYAWRSGSDPSRLDAVAWQYDGPGGETVTEHWTAETFELW